jgi:ABC-type polysaccharide/polyol phosphate export permease
MTERTAVDGRMPGAGISTAAVFRRYWYPLMALVRRDIKKRYATSRLGVLWAVLQPLILVSIYLVVFGYILRSGRSGEEARTYVITMLSGMLPWLALNEGLHRAIGSLREDRSLLERASFPAEVVPAGRVLTATVGEAVGLVLLVALAARLGRPLSAWLLALPLLMLLRVLITLGMAWCLSVLAVFITDLTEALSLLLIALLFLTPIFYSVDSLPEVLQQLIVLNPLYYLVTAYQRVLTQGANPFPPAFYAVAWAAILYCAGLWFFRTTVDRSRDFL